MIGDLSAGHKERHKKKKGKKRNYRGSNKIRVHILIHICSYGFGWFPRSRLRFTKATKHDIILFSIYALVFALLNQENNARCVCALFISVCLASFLLASCLFGCTWRCPCVWGKLVNQIRVMSQFW